MNNKQWNILNWNIRGINDSAKWLALRNKITESDCDIVCIQETKRDNFDGRYLLNFCPRKLKKFDYIPSNGASGGIITIWNDNLFAGETLHKNEYSISIRFTSKQTGECWILTNKYGPC